MKGFESFKFFQALKLDDTALLCAYRKHNGFALIRAAGKIAADQTSIKHVQ
jgi:hypothetical protein